EITVQFEDMSDREFDKRLQDLQTAVDRVQDLPEQLPDDPEVIEVEISSRIPLITVAIAGQTDESAMKKIAENLKDAILLIPDIADVRLVGVRDRQIWVEVDPDRLKAHNLPIDQIIVALRGRNLNLPAGTLEVGSSEFLVRTMGEFGNLNDIKDTIIKVKPAGTPLRISDVADVSHRYEKPLTLSNLKGFRSISLTPQKKSKGNTIKLVDQIRTLTEDFKKNLPSGVDIVLMNDYSVILRERIGILQNNAILGLILVVILLYVFMGLRNAIFAALGIPVSFLATFWFLNQIGQGLNGPSLFGLILVIGIVVDDAIVVIENTFRHIQEGMSPKDAAILGAEEVGWPVLTASLTTIAAFGPLMFMSGTSGQFMRIVPITAIAVILASLVEVFMILPSHVAEWGKRHDASNPRQIWFERVRQRYMVVLRKTLRWRYFIVISVVLFAVIVSWTAFLLLDKELFPGEDFPQFTLKVEMPISFGIKETSEAMKKIEQQVISPPGNEEIIAVITNVGLHTPTTVMQSSSMRSNIAELTVELVPKYDSRRKRTTDQIIDNLRERLKDFSGPGNILFTKMEGGPPQGKDVEVKIKGKRFETLREIASLLKSKLRQIDGVSEIQDDFRLGKPEIRIRVKQEKAYQYGLSVFQIAHSVRNALEGNTCTTYRDADEAIDVIVKYNTKSLKTVKELSNLLITTPMGVVIPLRDVAEINEENGYAEIHRFENKRSITVSATVDKEQISAFDVNQKLIQEFSDIEPLYPGYQLDFRGIFDQIQESFRELIKLFMVGILLMYAILGTQFKSFLQPFIIMFAVPFGVIGAMVGLLCIGAALSIIAMFGIVALSGIVVNDAIVLIDFINKRRSENRDVTEAIIIGSGLRLRPIILTSVTTISGLVPMAIGLGGKSPIWVPLAYIIIFGLFFSTLMTLFVMPNLYAITDDIGNFFRRFRQ
ncbi:TPA: efflux RND transporter permease subunit, partial [Candidatus Poribacteria bacterium]|nr:efflux RND transporter permease subunit [Candidatus Poribacteria bacterium]